MSKKDDTSSVASGAYWRKLKQRFQAEGSGVVTFCHVLKLQASDGKICSVPPVLSEGWGQIATPLYYLPTSKSSQKLEGVKQ